MIKRYRDLLRFIVADLRERARKAELSLGEASALLTRLASTEMEKDRRLGEFRTAYTPHPPSDELRPRWQALVGSVTLRTQADLDRLLQNLRGRIEPQLKDDVTLTIE